MMRKNLKNQKGITLIALVVTIIILLILAGISIATLTGENGLLNKANVAKEESKKAKSIAISLAQEGEPVERIARTLGETEKTIKEWLAETH